MPDKLRDPMLLLILATAALGLAYSNGANDNFKGVATLFGSGTTNYRRALTWATVTTLLGSLAALVLSASLITKFSGKGLIPAETAALPEYAASVAIGASLTVLFATRIGMPISTTHSLVGALIGAGWASRAPINYGQLTTGFAVPLLISPLMAIAATAILFQGAALFRRDGKDATSGEEQLPHKNETGKDRPLLDRSHYLSSGIVCFARGLNDTPKIAALLLVVPSFQSSSALVMTGVAIMFGGILNARRVAETMSQRITTMSHGQGFVANIVTGCIVIGASRLGVPVSTTHVSCGALFGIGAASGQANESMIRKIVLAWIFTLPAGALTGWLAFSLLGKL